jgi:hypothetical protein
LLLLPLAVPFFMEPLLAALSGFVAVPLTLESSGTPWRPGSLPWVLGSAPFCGWALFKLGPALGVAGLLSGAVAPAKVASDAPHSIPARTNLINVVFIEDISMIKKAARQLGLLKRP